MGKVIGFELKKLVSRIGIYVLVLLMAGLLVFSAFTYDPIKRDVPSYSLVGETVSDMYSSFTTGGIKDQYVASFEDVAFDASTYITKSDDYMKYNDANEINKLFTQFDNYCMEYKDVAQTPDEQEILLQGIKQSYKNLKSALDSTLEYAENGEGYYILCTNADRTRLDTIFNDINLNFTYFASHESAAKNYYTEYREELHDCLQSLVYPNLNSIAAKYAENGHYYSIINLRMEEIAQKIDKQYAKVVADSSLEQSKEIKDEINELYTRYVNCVTIFTKAYQSEMCTNALLAIKSKSDRADLIGYSNVSLYAQEENVVEYQYYIEHHSNPYDYASGLSVTHTSNKKVNAYDFTFFVMSLFAVVVTIFAIYLSAHTISGEIGNSTLRFIAIRPVKRGSLFMGKYLAIVIMSVILLLFGTIASFVTGAVMFGWQTADILMVVNSTYVVAVHPILVLGIFVLSTSLLVAFYSAVTIMISSFIKSDLLSMIMGVILYAVNLILPLFFGAGSWLKFYPFVNMNLFAYFGSNRLTTDSILAKLFNNIVYHGMNLWISLIYVVGITTILLIIGKTIFKKREL